MTMTSCLDSRGRARTDRSRTFDSSLCAGTSTLIGNVKCDFGAPRIGVEFCARRRHVEEGQEQDRTARAEAR